MAQAESQHLGQSRGVFGVPGANGAEFFRELGFDPGAPVPAYSPEIIRRYGTRQDGTHATPPQAGKKHGQH